MQIFIGFFVVIASVITGYVGHHGKIMVLYQPTEFIIIGGAGLGAIIIGSGFHGVKLMFHALKVLATHKPRGKQQYVELFRLLYALYDQSRLDGILGLEKHVDKPDESSIFQKFPEILGNEKLLTFICDNLRVIITGGGSAASLESLIDTDLDSRNEEEMHPGHMFSTLGDAMPAFGIVAAVLGVVVTMQALNGPPEEIGEKVAAALVGTFLGILMAYGIFSPLANAWTAKVKGDDQVLVCIRNSLLCFARGEPPMSCIEAARRQVCPEERPTFLELESGLKRDGDGGGDADKVVAPATPAA